jgi:hypothetical protein
MIRVDMVYIARRNRKIFCKENDRQPMEFRSDQEMKPNDQKEPIQKVLPSMSFEYKNFSTI